ncbi:MAG: MetQ/NlpA family ABC transporter substrate-binding protein [Gammaproteobacteria bacterium]|nr:MetQ/NlpA family ABC transporter substrate-binding protein [Gammaproteobacteria bacterium]
MKLKQLSLAILATVSVSAFAADLKVGGMNGPESDLLVAAQQVAKEKYNLDIEIIRFDDYVTPNIALNDGDIDLNAFQHRPYLERMVNDRGFKLAIVGDSFVYPIGAYSKKIKTVEELKDGAVIAVPNDPSNEGRTLILLHNKGLITLEDPKNLEASVLDIKENPRNFDFKEIEAAQLPRMLDEVDLAFINSGFAVDAGLSPADDAIFSEGTDSPYMNIIVAREADKDKESIKKFVQAYQSDAVKAAAEKAFKGAAVPGW